VIALPLSFRFLTKNISAVTESAKISSYFIFPFIYSFPFRIGFFNFCLGIPVLLFTLGLWLKTKNNQSFRATLLLCVLTTLLYFTHPFNFFLFLIIISILFLFDFLRRKNIKVAMKEFLRISGIFLPGLILMILFIYHNSQFQHDPPNYLSKTQLIKTIIDMGPIMTLSVEKEIFYAKTIFYSICFTLLLVAFKIIRKTPPAIIRWPWLAIVFSMFVVYFISPDWISSGGFISVRLALFFFLVLIIWIAATSISASQLMLPVVVILITHVFFIHYHLKETQFLSDDATELAGSENYMENNMVLLPLNHSTNWMHINFAGYMATRKAIVNLDNYEATKPHFPLMFKKGESVFDLMDRYGNRIPPCTNIANYETVTGHKIEYVSRWYFNGDLSDSCSAATASVLASQFELIYESPHKKLQLFKRKAP
jgi:hypothetical protein